jgi:hypothetical protein
MKIRKRESERKIFINLVQGRKNESEKENNGDNVPNQADILDDFTEKKIVGFPSDEPKKSVSFKFNDKPRNLHLQVERRLYLR